MKKSALYKSISVCLLSLGLCGVALADIRYVRKNGDAGYTTLEACLGPKGANHSCTSYNAKVVKKSDAVNDASTTTGARKSAPVSENLSTTPLPGSADGVYCLTGDVYTHAVKGGCKGGKFVERN